MRLAADISVAPLPAADPRWRAVLARDAGEEGHFVYAVATTGIYCRPGCPARAPKRENVRFFADAGEARAAGYRACRRCRPDAEASDTTRAALVAQACRRIEEAESPPPLAGLAAEAGLSPHHFHRVFKAGTGLTPKAYAAAVQARRLRQALHAPGASITAAVFEAGFNATSRFYARADTTLGMTPRQFRDGGAASGIRFAIGQCSLGAILVAASDKGICAILLGDDPDQLARELQDAFRKAEIVGDDADFAAMVAQVVGFVEAPRLGLDLPLDLRGTAFQARVWEALRTIPPGRTASYAEIARAIGAPQSSRAVALACGANRVAVAIPCHRVVRSDGALSGYRWGVARKQALLDRETDA